MQESLVTLYQYGPHESWKSIPTFHPDCLQIQAYLRFSGVPFSVHNSNNTKMSPDNSFPLLVINKEKVILGRDIVNCLADIGYTNLDELFEEAELRADISAMRYLIESSLQNYQLFSWWAEQDNVDTTIDASGNHEAPFPMNWILESKQKSSSIRKLELLDMSDKDAVYKEADSILKLLSEQLADKQFLFGNTPSTADAAAFGILASQFFSSFKANRLTTLLCNYNNLVSFVERIFEGYFKEYEVNAKPLQDWVQQFE